MYKPKQSTYITIEGHISFFAKIVVIYRTMTLNVWIFYCVWKNRGPKHEPGYGPWTVSIPMAPNTAYWVGDGLRPKHEMSPGRVYQTWAPDISLEHGPGFGPRKWDTDMSPDMSPTWPQTWSQTCIPRAKTGKPYFINIFFSPSRWNFLMHIYILLALRHH